MEMKEDTITLKKIGITIAGKVTITFWGGGEGEIEMIRTFIPNDKISKENILRCVNDGEFGCESIDEAEIDIYDTYEHNVLLFNRTIITNNPIYHRLYCRGI